jgi:hypothetical protein
MCNWIILCAQMLAFVQPIFAAESVPKNVDFYLQIAARQVTCEGRANARPDVEPKLKQYCI